MADAESPEEKKKKTFKTLPKNEVPEIVILTTETERGLANLQYLKIKNKKKCGGEGACVSHTLE